MLNLDYHTSISDRSRMLATMRKDTLTFIVISGIKASITSEVTLVNIFLELAKQYIKALTLIII